MRDPDSFDDEDAGGTVFRDVILLALTGFVAIVVLLLPHLGAKGEAREQAPAPPGNVVVEIRWPDAQDTDVDLWVQAPGDVPVGYSNKGGIYFNLLRDDLGHRNDSSGINYEVSYSRGTPAGEYAVNVHLYRNRAQVYPVPVQVIVSVNREEQIHTRRLLETHVALNREGEELTAVRFALDAEGGLVADSINSLQKDLRSAWAK